MGNYLNPDNSKFQRAVNSDIYVDKTGLIKYTNRVMNTMQAYVCVSQAKAFWKIYGCRYADCLLQQRV